MSASAREESRVHPVDEVLPVGKLTGFGLQHVMVMYASAVAVPFIVGAGLGLPPRDIAYLVTADLLLCGVGTLLQSLGIWKVGIQLPMVMGAAYTSVTPMILIGNSYGLATAYGAVLFAGIGMFVLSWGFTKLLRFFPPVVTGAVITVIGLSLIPAGVRLVVGPDPTAPDYAALDRIALGAGTLLIVVVLYRFLPRLFRSFAILLSLVVATIIALLFGAADMSGIGEGAVFAFPEPFHFGFPEFNLAASFTMLLVVLVLSVECIGQSKAVGEVVDRPVEPDRVGGAIRADASTTMLASVFQAFPYTTFAQNIGVISLTGVRSRFVTVASGIILILLGLFPPMGRIVAAIPQPVLGAVAVAMFALVAVSGMRILATVDFNRTSNLVIVAISVGLGLIPTASPDFYTNFPPDAALFLRSGVAVGAVAAVLLNLLFNHVRWLPTEPVEEVTASGMAEVVPRPPAIDVGDSARSRRP
jgi:xanthine permease